jgi:hypothetical protein
MKPNEHHDKRLKTTGRLAQMNIQILISSHWMGNVSDIPFLSILRRKTVAEDNQCEPGQRAKDFCYNQ